LKINHLATLQSSSLKSSKLPHNFIKVPEEETTCLLCTNVLEICRKKLSFVQKNVKRQSQDELSNKVIGEEEETNRSCASHQQKKFPKKR
jgi:hypothetical protein